MRRDGVSNCWVTNKQPQWQGCRRLCLLRWWLWALEGSQEWSSSKCTVVTCERKVLEMNGCLRVQGWLYITLSFFLHPRGHAAILWRAAETQLSSQRSTLWILSVEWEKEVNQPLRWRNVPMPSVTDLENVTRIGAIVLQFISRRLFLDGSFWI